MPRVRYFKPRGIPLTELTEVYLTIEGAEALRLVDAKGLDLNTAAGEMNVSRHTFGRILTQARRIVAEAITGGMAIRIDGGDFMIKGKGDQDPVPKKNPLANQPGNATTQTGDVKMTKTISAYTNFLLSKERAGVERD